MPSHKIVLIWKPVFNVCELTFFKMSCWLVELKAVSCKKLEGIFSAYETLQPTARTKLLIHLFGLIKGIGSPDEYFFEGQ
jgi:hypothetical protein